jgi:hypothetical protein
VENYGYHFKRIAEEFTKTSTVPKVEPLPIVSFAAPPTIDSFGWFRSVPILLFLAIGTKP